MNERKGVTRCCSECRFYRHDVPLCLLTADGLTPGGQCHRLAPRPVRPSALFVEWPRVPSTDWCGEFEPRTQNQDNTNTQCSPASQPSLQVHATDHDGSAWATWAEREARQINGVAECASRAQQDQ